MKKITIKSNQFEIPSFWTNYNDELLREIVCMKKAKCYLEMSEEGKRQIELVRKNKLKTSIENLKYISATNEVTVVIFNANNN